MPIALLSHTVVRAVGGGAVTTSDINTVGATLIVISLGWFEFIGPPTILDSKTNSWQPLGAQGGSGVGESKNGLFYVENPVTDAAHNFSNSASNYSTLVVAAFTGTAVASVWDQQNGNYSSAGVTSIQTGSVTPSTDNQLVIAGLGLRDSSALGDTVSINGGFTISDQLPGLAGNSLQGAMAYLIQTTATAANPTWSWTDSDTGAPATIATFKPTPIVGVDLFRELHEPVIGSTAF